GAAGAGPVAEAEPHADARSAAPASGTDSTAPSEQGAAAAPEAPAAAAQGATGPAGLSAPEVRRRWPEVLDTLARIKRTTWALISQDAQIVDLDTTTRRLAFSTSGLASSFRNGQHAEILQRALVETLGLDVRIEPIVADGPAGGGLGGPGSGGPGGPGGPGAPGGGSSGPGGAGPDRPAGPRARGSPPGG